jgi:hypothetical protein
MGDEWHIGMSPRRLSEEVNSRSVEIDLAVAVGVDPALDDTHEREVVRANLCNRIGKLRECLWRSCVASISRPNGAVPILIDSPSRG